MKVFQTDNIDIYKKKALQWASLFDTACYFDSNGYSDPYSAFDVLIAAGAQRRVESRAGTAFSALDSFLGETTGYRLGFLGYDLKNEIEDLTSSNPDHLHFPDLFFFEPVHLILIKNGKIEINSSTPEIVHSQIEAQVFPKEIERPSVNFRSRLSKSEYLNKVEDLRQHIKKGDVYEVTFCQEFFSDAVSVEPVALFSLLNSVSPTPFANFFKLNDKYVVSATPERYLSRRRNKLISQPIKGTAARHLDPQQDQLTREALRRDEKEQAENVMIVDLVRNDLTRCAIPGTVYVEELFGIYSFQQVHQMISTVVCAVDEATSSTEIIHRTFPMGSMTGAPKVRAMELIEKYEESRRGVFSGAVGYFAPNGDFDFNVIIRSLLYNSSEKYLSYQVGSAITYDAEPLKEYDECLLKASAIQTTLSSKTSAQQ